jgi:cryptochrome
MVVHLADIHCHLTREILVSSFLYQPNTSPAEFEDGMHETTVLSSHMSLGTLSPRRFYHEVRAVQTTFRNFSEPPVSLLGQLMFREMFHSISATTPNYEQMEGNALCRQIDWDTDEDAMERWRRWEAAETGYPWIDALMVQLKTEGWMHHLGRHSVACFLTRGDCWVSWEKGAETFERYLVDFDESLNASNWMWLSASAFFTSYFRVYSPVAFGKRWSVGPAFVRHYLPVLKDVPDKYILEPWKMPESIARKSGVKIGKNYPAPMVDHADVSKKNIARMREAYHSDKADGSGKKRPSSTSSRSGNTKTYKMSK